MLPIPQNVIALDIRGTLTVCDGGPNPSCQKVVFQGCPPEAANYFVGNHEPRMMRAYVIPHDPKTQAQLARRARLAAGVAAWHALPSEEKAAWESIAVARQISGYNAYMSWWLRSG